MLFRSPSLPLRHQAQPPGLEAEMTPLPEYIRPGYRGSGKLAGKVALITGGDSGIGRAVALRFAREGANVAIAYKAEEQADANETERLVLAEGRRCLQLPGNLRHAPFCEELAAQTVRELGQLSIVASNAAEQLSSTAVTGLSNEQFENTFRASFFPRVRVVKAALPYLHAGDSIIATSSADACWGNQRLVGYSVTKGASTAYVRAITRQLAAKKIRANTVAPGPIWPPLIPADKAAAGPDAPRKRLSQPLAVAPAYVFLASEDALCISGQAICPTGGEGLTT